MTTIKGFPAPLVQAALADALAHRRGGTPAVLAVSGLQGSGKSTFAAQVVEAAGHAGLQAATLSIDDVYLTRDARLRLAREVHPLLATRGPAGTHDVALALDTLDAIAARRPLRLPRFDKLADDRLPMSQWPPLQRPLDLLVLEGWFLATPAEHDPDGRWRRWCNAALARDYPPLWARFDRLWLLLAPSFAVVPQWRWQQEQALLAAQPGRTGMDQAAIARFVQAYERTSRQALRTLPALADRTLRLDAQRRIAADGG
jgi:D-glycerate 3-kinase